MPAVRLGCPSAAFSFVVVVTGPMGAAAQGAVSLTGHPDHEHRQERRT